MEEFKEELRAVEKYLIYGEYEEGMEKAKKLTSGGSVETTTSWKTVCYTTARILLARAKMMLCGVFAFDQMKKRSASSNHATLELQVGIDLIGPLPETKKGNKYIVTLLDYFSKWPEACPIPNKTALAVAQFLFEMFCRFGCCEVVISDQGREFVNAVQAELFALTGTKHCLTYLHTIHKAMGLQRAKQKATKLSPFELMYCLKAILPVEMDPLNEVSSGNEKECEDDEKDAEMGIIMDEEDDENTGCSGIIEDWIDGTTHEACSGLEVDHIIQRAKEMQQLRDKIYERALANIQVAQQKDKALYDKKHASSKVFSVGTQVLLRNSARDTKKGDKLKPRWMGPYCIHTVNDKGVYTLRNARTGKVLKNGVNVCRLTEYHSHSLESSVLPQPISSVAPNCLSSTGENKTVVIDENAPTPEKMQSKVWISTLKLYSSDKDDLENGRELSDAVIDAAQTLLKHCYTNISSFQSPLLGRVLQFEPASHNAVQIHHTEGHWVCSSNIGAKQGEVLLMDSLVSSPSDSLLLQLAQIYQAAPDVQNMSIRVLPVQQQKGSKDCGLFAVAFATELCSGEDPTRAVFKHCSMRQHLYNCLEAGEISRFPQYTFSSKEYCQALHTQDF
eukprot:Em0675g4a